MCEVVWWCLGVCVWIHVEEGMADRAYVAVAQTFVNKLQLQSLCEVILNYNGVVVCFFLLHFSFILFLIFLD